MSKYIMFLFILINNCYSMNETNKNNIQDNTNNRFVTINGDLAPNHISQNDLSNKKETLNQISRTESFYLLNDHNLSVTLIKDKMIKLQEKNNILQSKIEQLSNQITNIQQILNEQMKNQNLREELQILLQKQPDFEKIKLLIKDTNINNKNSNKNKQNNKMDNILSNFMYNLNNILKQCDNFKAEECSQYNNLLQNISEEFESLEEYFESVKIVLPDFYENSYLKNEIQHLIEYTKEMKDNTIKYTKKLNELNFKNFINESKNKINIVLKHIQDEFNNKYKIFNNNKININKYNEDINEINNIWENLKKSEPILQNNIKEK